MSKQLPIMTSEEVKPEKLKIQIYFAIYRWQDKDFVDLETGNKVPSKLWQFVGLNRLNGVYRNGRIVKGKTVSYKVKDERSGLMVEKTSSKTKGRVYGFEAVAQALTALGVSISAEKVKKMVENAIANGMNHVKFVLKSDLVPTSPDRYSGKNKWLLVQNVPSTDEVYERINKALKATGSTLRVKAGLRYRLVE